MNNNTEITLRGIKWPICFGMFAEEEFWRLVNEQRDTKSNSLQTINVIYCGIYNGSLIKRQPAISYEDAADQLSELLDSDSGIKVIADVLSVYTDSRMDTGVKKTTEALKKKAEGLSQSLPIGAQLKDQPTEN